MKDCLFCEVRHVTNRVVWENKLFYMIFDIFPVSPGHSLLIPKRHVKDFSEINNIEWNGIRNSIQEVVHIIEMTNLQLLYTQILNQDINKHSEWFIKKALASQNIKNKPDGYNHGFSDGRAAGRTIDHLHWHIIPRFEGDMEDPTGGVRLVIPKMGNYRIKR